MKGTLWGRMSKEGKKKKKKKRVPGYNPSIKRLDWKPSSQKQPLPLEKNGFVEKREKVRKLGRSGVSRLGGGKKGEELSPQKRGTLLE